MNKTFKIWGIPLLFFILLTAACAKQKDEANNQLITTASGLQFKILKEGQGPIAEPGDEVMIFETTSYRDGTVLYSNEGSDHPIKVKIGANQVTQGVDEGLQGMRAGEIRELHIPHYLAKRSVYPDHISPDSSLVIKIILNEIVKP